MGFEILVIAVLIISIVLHEVAHGYAAFLLGDLTAKHAGRLTLNPVSHIDLLGTIIVPATLILFSFGIVFGWAKPVPYNPYNLRHRYGEALVAGAGPAVNIILAVIFGILYRVGVDLFPEALLSVLSVAVFVNLFLAFLNLIPLPPLDGSKIVFNLLPIPARMALSERLGSLINVQGFAFLILLLLFISYFLLTPLAFFVNIFSLILTGASGF